MSDSHQEEPLQPARDLLARVPSGNPGRIYDLGCGAGDTTRLLKARWPRATHHRR